ncbi:MAG: two-component system sensor histidine kinase NtrB, partial [Thermodesulfobacteriota bacterium]
MIPNKIPYKDIFDSIPEGIVITTEKLEIVSINESSENLLNISRAKATGQKLSRYFPAEITKTCKKVIAEERIIHEDEVSYRTPLDSIIKIEFTGSPIYKNDGNLCGLILQIKDKEKINFLTKMNTQESMEENYEFLARGLAHELKNPLSGIKGAAQLLKGELNSDEIARCSEIIVKEVDRLRDLINRIKRIDNFDKDSFSFVDIHELLFDIIFLESKIRNNIKFQHNFDITIPHIFADKNSIKQLFINIIKNAVDAVGNSGEIIL